MKKSAMLKTLLVCAVMFSATDGFAKNPGATKAIPFKKINYNLRSIDGKDRITLSINYMQKRNIVPNLSDVIDLSDQEVKIFKDNSDKSTPIQDIRCVDPKGCKLVIKKKTADLTLYGIEGKYQFTTSDGKNASVSNAVMTHPIN